MQQVYKDHNGLIAYTLEPGDNFSLNTFSIPSGNDYTPGHYYQFARENDANSTTYFGSLAFQNGPIKAHGVNGITNEALLAILIHRTKILNDKFPCRANELAIQFMETALAALESRTADRISRGVEGTNTL